VTAIADFLFWEPAHWIMQTRQFRNLKRRAELSAHDLGYQPGAAVASDVTTTRLAVI
jgi:hypothetical protein